MWRGVACRLDACGPKSVNKDFSKMLAGLMCLFESCTMALWQSREKRAVTVGWPFLR